MLLWTYRCISSRCLGMYLLLGSTVGEGKVVGRDGDDVYVGCGGLCR